MLTRAAFMADIRYDLFIFDADGTLRDCTVPGQFYPRQEHEWVLLHGVNTRLVGLNPHKRYAVASNQSGVALRHLSEPMALCLLDDCMSAAFRGAQWPVFWRTYMCPHHRNAGCECRKPAPGMLLRAMREASAAPSRTLFIGDMDTDEEAAKRAGCDFMWAWEFFGWPEPKGEG